MIKEVSECIRFKVRVYYSLLVLIVILLEFKKALKRFDVSSLLQKYIQKHSWEQILADLFEVCFSSLFFCYSSHY